MNLEFYFEPALEMGQLISEFDEAEGERKEEIGRKIYQSRYMERFRETQIFSGEDFLHGEASRKKVNAMKKYFFYNPAIPRMPEAKLHRERHYHRHEYLEIVIIFKGTYTQSINGILHCHQAGDICILNPNVIHRDATVSLKDRIMFLGLSQAYLHSEVAHETPIELSSFIKNFNSQGTQQYMLFHPPEFEAVKELVLQIMNEDTEKNPGYHFVVHGLLIRLFHMFTKGENFSLCIQSESEIHANLISEALQYMREHLKDISRNDLARFFNYNPDYINRLMISNSGSTYSKNIQQMRLEAVAVKLRKCDESVNTIIREVGFSNKGYFNRIFKEKFGVLPGEYRKNM